jgi:hypothetical protein
VGIPKTPQSRIKLAIELSELCFRLKDACLKAYQKELKFGLELPDAIMKL